MNGFERGKSGGDESAHGESLGRAEYVEK